MNENQIKTIYESEDGKRNILDLYDKQLEANLKTLPAIEKKFMEDNPEKIRNLLINAVRNQG